MPTLKDVKAGYSSREKSVFSVAENEAFRSYEESFGKSESDFESVKAVVTKWASNGVFTLVGQGEQTNARCGLYSGRMLGCLNLKGHDHVGLDGVDYAGLVYVHPVFHFCDRPSCKICFRRGWSVREAGHMKQRLAQASKLYGLVEHVVLSVPISDYDKSYEVLRKNALKALKVRGIIGGSLVWHMFRYANREESLRLHVPFGWRVSPHWHVLGFLKDSYSRCRNCEKFSHKGIHSCVGCFGFEMVTREQNKIDGYICKVLGERVSVRATAYYELNHSSIRVGSVRFHPCTWFGVCSYRKLRVVYVKEKLKCPICGLECVNIRYFGGQHICVDRCSPDFKPDLFMRMNEGQGDVFVKAGEKDYG